MAAPRLTVLVTGMSGLIGRAVRRRLQGRYELRALNRRRVDGVPCHQADIGDLPGIEPAFRGVDVVVHLAAAVGTRDWDDVLRGNVVGTYNVFEAARRVGGVRRIVYASGGAVVSGWERDPPYAQLVAGHYEGLGPWTRLTHDTGARS